MSTDHPGLQQVVRVLADEGLLGDFLVPLDATRLDDSLGRVLAPSNWLRKRLAQWRHKPRGRSAAALEELAVATVFRLPRSMRASFGPQRLVVQRYRAMARATVQAMQHDRPEAMLFLQQRYDAAIAKAAPPGAAAWLFVLGDEWDLAKSLAAAAGRMPPGPLRSELEAEFPAGRVSRLERALSRAAAAITESTRMAEFARRAAKPGTPIVSIGQGVDTNVFVPGPQREFGARPLRVIQLSRIVHGKGLLVADEAAALAGAAVESWTVPGWESELSPVLTRSVPHLRLPGALARAAIVRALQGADVFVLPTLGDSMPRAVLEGMAAGLPVITTDRSGYDDVIRDGENGFIVPVLDAEAIAHHLVRLSGDGDLRSRMGLAARATAERFTWEAMGERFRAGLHESLLPSLRLPR